jgi:hypothetical protein
MELKHSYAFYFETDEVDDAIIQKIALSFRFN